MSFSLSLKVNLVSEVKFRTVLIFCNSFATCNIYSNSASVLLSSSQPGRSADGSYALAHDAAVLTMMADARSYVAARATRAGGGGSGVGAWLLLLPRPPCAPALPLPPSCLLYSCFAILQESGVICRA